jgi:hypothetical protein
MKNCIIFYLVSFCCSHLFSQVNVNKEYSSMEFGIGVPLNFVNKSSESVIENDMGFESKNQNSLYIAFSHHALELINFKLDCSINSHKYQSSLADFNLSTLSSSFGLGFGKWFKNRFLLECNLDFGVMASFQNLTYYNEIEDLYSIYLQNEANQVYLVSKPIISIGLTPRLNYKITNRYSIVLQYKYTISNISKLGVINNQRIFNNYSNISLGIQINNIFRTNK